jgi:hypothetical protein
MHQRMKVSNSNLLSRHTSGNRTKFQNFQVRQHQSHSTKAKFTEYLLSDIGYSDSIRGCPEHHLRLKQGPRDACRDRD